eukprot:GHVP01054277.1.p2 GENE.GHVP01054277.1~~GHVP01054277.1.p2  ORF type:complete len:311 (+),score=52.16 GHVP01054277.1:1800-2732(+)
MELTKESLSRLEVSRIFDDHTSRIDSLDIDDTGRWSITASSFDNTINFYDLLEGEHKKKVYSTKHGVSCAKITHKETCILYSSVYDGKLLYHSLHDNKVLRIFDEHKYKIKQIEISPIDDTILTTSPYEGLKMWDIRSERSFAYILSKDKNPLICFDPEAQVFCVGFESRYLRMYDIRNYQNGPFLLLNIKSKNKSTWKSIEFTNDGKYIIIVTEKGTIYKLDSFDGTPFIGLNPNISISSTSILPDSNHIFTGCSNGSIQIISLIDGSVINEKDVHNNRVLCTAFSPHLLIGITTGNRTALWLDPGPLY